MKQIFFNILYPIVLLVSIPSLHAQWIRQYPLAKLEDVLDLDVGNDGYGFAVGSNDLILRKPAASDHWELLPGFGQGWRFQAVDYLEGSGGNIAVAAGDGLIFTLDNGEHWNELSAPPAIYDVKLFSLDHMIVRTSSALFVLENKIWKNLNVPATQLDGSFIISDQVMWAYSSSSVPAKIFYTIDGGLNWNINQDIQQIDNIKFFDAQNGIALDGRDVYRTINGGQNWTLISSNSLKNSAYDFAFGSSVNVLVAATFNAKPNISIDGGVTWNDITTGLINQRSFSASAVSDTEFWVGNDLTGVMHSTDGGATWNETSGPTRNIIQDVHFINKLVGFAIGQKGLILRTTNGGVNWEDISFGTRSHLSIHGLNANDLWIGTNQRILHSNNAGDTWTEAGIFTSGNINDVLAISANRILAASTTGRIYLSTNAGMTWDSVYNSGLQMRSLAKIDDQHYMATGFNGVIVRSDDMGQTWHLVTIPAPALQYEKSFFLNGEGWLITSSFKKSMWHTTNGGDSWDTLSLPIDRSWYGVHFITKDTGVVVSRSSAEGRAYITFDGGHHWQSGYITSYPFYGATGIPNPNGTMWIYGFGSDIENLQYCNFLPVISNFIGSPNPCEKDTVMYSVTSQNIQQFSWHFPPGWNIVGNANNDTVQVVVGTGFGNIYVFGSNDCGETGQLGISAGPILHPVLDNISGEQSPCLGNIVSYTVNQMHATNFSWSIPGDWGIQGNPNLSTVMLQVGDSDGLLSVIGSNTCGSDTSTDLVVVPRPLPTIVFISGNLTPCPGDTVVYTFDSQLANIFSITKLGLDDWTFLNSQIPNTIKAIAGANGGTVEIIANNDCGFSSPLSLDIIPLFVPQVAVLENGIKLFPSVQGISYQWYLNGLLISGATMDTLVPINNGNYSVLVTFDSGCSALSDPVPFIIDGVFSPSSIIPIDVYPVPASDELYIKGITGDFNFAIIDLLGKKLIQRHSSINKIQIGNLSEGLYLLKVEKEGKNYLTRFIVEKK